MRIFHLDSHLTGIYITCTCGTSVKISSTSAGSTRNAGLEKHKQAPDIITERNNLVSSASTVNQTVPLPEDTTTNKTKVREKYDRACTLLRSAAQPCAVK